MRVCKVKGCGRKHDSHGYCSLHSKQQRRGRLGKPRLRAEKGLPAKWLADHVGHEGTECLIWPFGSNGLLYRYGTLLVDGVNITASRAMCIAAHGPPPFPDAHARHTCDNPPCVNPNHLVWGSAADNSNDKVRRGRAPRGGAITRAKLSDAKALAIYRDDRSQSKIAAAYNVGASTVQDIKDGTTWRHVTGAHPPVRIRDRRGALIWSAKLSNAQVLAIFNATGRHCDIGELHGAPTAAVQQIKSGRTWSWLTGATPQPRSQKRKDTHGNSSEKRDKGRRRR